MSNMLLQPSPCRQHPQRRRPQGTTSMSSTQASGRRGTRELSTNRVPSLTEENVSLNKISKATSWRMKRSSQSQLSANSRATSLLHHCFHNRSNPCAGCPSLYALQTYHIARAAAISKWWVPISSYSTLCIPALLLQPPSANPQKQLKEFARWELFKILGNSIGLHQDI